jgi:LytTR family transcriptional regulator, CO-responsive transcriptional regulator RcoM
MVAVQTVSPLYLLERFEVGVVVLNEDRHVISMNDFARRVLPVDVKQPFGQMVLDFHPERSKPKVAFMLDQAAVCPVTNPPPMTMIINIPERVLLIKVTRSSNAQREPMGYVLVFYDITEVVATDGGLTPAEAAPWADQTQPRQLQRIPTSSGGSIVFVEVVDIRAIHSDGHYSRVMTAEGARFCNLSIGDLEKRLDAKRFMRVHRTWLVDMASVREMVREAGRTWLIAADCDERVPVSRTSHAAVVERLRAGRAAAA